MSSRGRRYGDARANVDRLREYQPAEAVALVRSLSSAKFDETVEIHVRTGLNVRHADEQLRGTIALPNGLGKDVRIIVFAQGEKVRDRAAQLLVGVPNVQPGANVDLDRLVELRATQAPHQRHRLGGLVLA